MKCQNIREWIWDFCREELPDDIFWAIAEHLSGCQGCALEYEAQKKLLSAINQVAEEDLEPNPNSWPDFCTRLERSQDRPIPPRRMGYAVAATLVAVCGLALFFRFQAPLPHENRARIAKMVGVQRIPDSAKKHSDVKKGTKLNPKVKKPSGPPQGVRKPSAVRGNRAKQAGQKKASPESWHPKVRRPTEGLMMLASDAPYTEPQRRSVQEDVPVQVESVRYVLPQMRPQTGANDSQRRLVIDRVDTFSTLQASYTY